MIHADRPKTLEYNDSYLYFGSHLSCRKANENLRILRHPSQNWLAFSTALLRKKFEKHYFKRTMSHSVEV